jgi:hypothetical protein
MTSLAELFPDGDHRFHLTLRRGEPREFFAARDASGAVLAERRRWLAAEPARHAALLPEGGPLLAELARMAAPWGAAGKTIADLGGELEPDVLLLSPDAEGNLRLRGGALVFPTGWALEEKLGRTLDEIHGVVPGLNPAIGAAIRQFFARLKPGVAFLRDNWGLAATDELNLHPARGLAAPTRPVALERLWLRVEHQALVALPETGGVLFGIRLALHRLDAIAGTPAGAGLRRALETMPAELAAYKRIDAVRAEIAARL